jgi:recombination protein RecR
MTLPPSYSIAEPLARLIEELNKLPGIGPKSAQRLAYFLWQASEEQARALAQAIIDVKEKISLCSICQNIAESDPCSICQDKSRDQGKICIVEQPLNVLALETTRSYHGLYHVLHGTLSPVRGINPEDLKISELFLRLEKSKVEEVILAMSPTLEGEATSLYLQRQFAPTGIKVTHLAWGLPFGSDLEYADEVTLARAIEGRQEFKT